MSTEFDREFIAAQIAEMKARQAAQREAIKAEKEATAAALKAQREAAKMEREATKAQLTEAMTEAKAQREALKLQREAEKLAKLKEQEAKRAEREAKRLENERTKLSRMQEQIENPQPIRNGIRRPKSDSKCGAAWDLFDKMSNELGDVVPVSDAIAEGVRQGLVEGNLRSEHYRWRTFNGIFGRVKKAKPSQEMQQAA